MIRVFGKHKWCVHLFFISSKHHFKIWWKSRTKRYCSDVCFSALWMSVERLDTHAQQQTFLEDCVGHPVEHRHAIPFSISSSCRREIPTSDEQLNITFSIPGDEARTSQQLYILWSRRKNRVSHWEDKEKQRKRLAETNGKEVGM